MTETDETRDPIIEMIALEARGGVLPPAESRLRILAAVRAEPAPAAFTLSRAVRGWFTEWHSWSYTPLRAAAVAAGLLGVGVMAGWSLLGRDRVEAGGNGGGVVTVSAPASTSRDGAKVQVFALVAPDAREVSLVGDFNEWDLKATPMTRTGPQGLWQVSVPLAAGRHTYSFVVTDDDSQEWRVDPRAPLAPDDGFGHTNSVILVGIPTQ
jgi:hypothetical protein